MRVCEYEEIANWVGGRILGIATRSRNLLPLKVGLFASGGCNFVRLQTITARCHGGWTSPNSEAMTLTMKHPKSAWQPGLAYRND